MLQRLAALWIASWALSAAHAAPSEAQAARLAELRPDSAMISRSSEKVYIRGGDLGRFDAQRSAVENLRRLIDHLGLLPPAADDAEFELSEQTPGFMRFTQLIGGVPVTGRIEVEFNPDGQVREARLSVVDPARAPRAQPIAKERAMQIASRACSKEAGVADAEVDLDDFPGLHYQPTAMGEPLKLQYRFAARAGYAPSNIVTIDAFTGAFEIAPGAIP